MPTLKETLKRLATTFTVRDIMVPREDLKCEAGEAERLRSRTTILTAM